MRSSAFKPDPELLRTARRSALLFGIFATLGGLVSLSAWALDMSRLADWGGDGIAIQPNAAVAATLAGTALLLLAFGLRRLALVPGIIAGLTGAATLFQHLSGLDLNIDTLLMFDRVWGQTTTTAPGRMGVPASTSFTLLGLAFCLSATPPFIRRAAPVLALAVVGITWLSLIGYLFGASALFNVPFLTAIALQTSMMLFAVAIGLVAANAGHEPMRLLAEQSSAGRLARRALPFLIMVPIALAFVVLQGFRVQLFDTSMGTALLVLMLTMLLLVLLWRAVTEARAGEAALHEADRRKDEFLATLAHELRNPLAPVSNALTLLKRSNDPKVLEPTRQIMERQIGHMVRLIDDLLDISRISSGKIELQRQDIDAVSVVRDAVEASRPICERNRHELSVEVPSAPVRMRADPVRLAQIFSNLISNASKFTPPGGHIHVMLETRGGRMQLSVTDNGIGIPPDKLHQIFEMFAQVDSSIERRHDGLGIGLTLAKRMAELHGGTIEAYSPGPGKGSTFTVKLPGAFEGKELRAETRVAKPREHLRVLVVDDNRDTAESLAMLLRMNGTEIHTAHDGEHAVDAAVELKPDAILLDIGLPKMNGYQACREIRERLNGHKVLILALTGYGQDEDRNKSLAAGFDGHLVKPVDHAELDRILATVRPG